MFCSNVHLWDIHVDIIGEIAENVNFRGLVLNVQLYLWFSDSIYTL